MQHIVPVKALRDNYIWLIVDADRHVVWAVDPGESQPVLDFIQAHHYHLKGVLVTHHHADHTAGIPDLLRHDAALRVYGSEKSPLDCLTDRLREGATLSGAFAGFSALAVPGHTLDHLAYYGHEAVFCGDTLFSAGCGRVFEGTAEMMYASLMKLAGLPEGVKMYCGHEYAAANLAFAAVVDPENQAIHEKQHKIASDRRAGTHCTLPSTIGDEKLINPFFRCHEPVLIAAAEKVAGRKTTGPADVFRILRAWKDHFSPP